MGWLLSDLGLLETDVDQLRLHLGWLLEDLRARRDELAGRAPALAAATAELEDCLERAARLDGLLATLRGELRAA